MWKSIFNWNQIVNNIKLQGHAGLEFKVRIDTFFKQEIQVIEIKLPIIILAGFVGPNLPVKRNVHTDEHKKGNVARSF